MKSMALVLSLPAVILLSAGDVAQAQSFRGGFGGPGRSGFAAPAPSRVPTGRTSQAPQRSVSPQFHRWKQPPPHTGFRTAPGGKGIQHGPVFGGKRFPPFAPFAFPHFGRGRFFPHQHGLVIIDVPQFWGSTIITEIAPGVVGGERRYLPDSQSDARVREPGQLAPFDPTPLEVVERMLMLAEVRNDDVIYDLGSGDGRVLIAAAKKYGTRGVGFEIDGGLIKLARENARREGVGKLIEIRHEDFRSVDLSPASVVTLYLSHDGNLAVREQLKRQLKPGTRVVSYTFDMGDWPPKIAESYRDAAGQTHALYLWEITESPMARKDPEPMLQPFPTRSAPLIIEIP